MKLLSIVASLALLGTVAGATSSTGGQASSTGGQASSTGGQASSTGPSGSSTGVISSTGGSGNSTAPTQAPTAAPTPLPTCGAQTDCGSCYAFKAGCVWCFIPGENSNTTACKPVADVAECPDLPDPFGGLDLVTHGEQACSLATCIEETQADLELIEEINDDFQDANKECFDKWDECDMDINQTSCVFSCDLTATSKDALSTNCSAIPKGGEVCDRSFTQDLQHWENGTWHLEKVFDITRPFCMPKSCAAAPDLTSIAFLAENDTLANTPDCTFPESCKSTVSFACTIEPAKKPDGMSTGTIIAIIAASCLGLALACYCGAQSCKQKDNDYEAF